MTAQSTEKITAIAFDADDTLWQNKQFFRLTQERFAALLRDYSGPLTTEMRDKAAFR